MRVRISLKLPLALDSLGLEILAGQFRLLEKVLEERIWNSFNHSRSRLGGQVNHKPRVIDAYALGLNTEARCRPLSGEVQGLTVRENVPLVVGHRHRRAEVSCVALSDP